MEQRREDCEKLLVGIVGCGVVGSALAATLELNPAVELVLLDPAKRLFGDVFGSNLDAAFICVGCPVCLDGKQDPSEIVQIASQLENARHVWIRSTIVPSTLQLAQEANPRVEYMPEFLTERTAVQDAQRQKLVFTGSADAVALLEKLFPGRDHVVATSTEAILAKYTHNVFGALKVTYFNCVADLCRQLGARYEKVLDGALASGYVNACHTLVPGPDGKFGYGGKCFPENVQTAISEFVGTRFEKLVGSLPEINRSFRGS